MLTAAAFKAQLASIQCPGVFKLGERGKVRHVVARDAIILKRRYAARERVLPF